MQKLIVLFFGAAVLLFAGITSHRAHKGTNDESEIEKLAEQRIKYLQQRIEIVEELIKQGIVGATDLIEPKLDLIQAKLEYAKSNDERRKLYDDMLKQYDRLIELAELSRTSPTESNEIEKQIRSRDDLLYLKSQRIKIQIERESLD